MACGNTSVDPFVIPVRNVSFSGNTTTGLPWTGIMLGDPPQLRYFKLSTLDDTLSIAGPDSCTDGNDDVQCAALYGGFYEPVQSKTYHEVPKSQWNSSHEYNSRVPALWFYEKVQVTGSTLYEYPMIQYTSKTRWANVLGINNSSKFLSKIASSGLAPSKSWGLWIGNSETDGSLVVGGYDQARVSGKFATFPMASRDLSILVKSIDYNAPNGSTETLLFDPEGQKVALSPEDPDLQLTPSVFDSFVSATGATRYSSLGKWGWPAGTELGNITIGFLNNYKVTLPARDLWQPFTDYDATSNMNRSDESVIISRIVSRDNSQNFGAPFFRSVYMRYFQMGSYFELATVNTQADVQSSIQSYCSDTSTDVKGLSPVSSTPIAAIIGGALGGFAALALIVLLVWLLLRRQRRRKSARLRPIFMELMAQREAKRSSAPFELPIVTRYELPS